MITNSTATSICANLIVKNEVHVIQRCLDSLAPFVNAFCIIDTGSIDGTDSFIAQYLASKKLLLHRRPWVNFGHNRQEALELARPFGDYILFMDADDVLIGPENFIWPTLTLAGYQLPIHYGDTRYARCALVKASAPWRWEAPVHEYLTSDIPLTQGSLKEPYIKVMHDGARSKDPATYLKDIELLKAAEPTPRNIFYLAQSFKDSRQTEKALETYQRRAAMEGWEEEGWYASYEVARMKEALNFASHEVTGAYLAAFQRRPTRAEPLYHLSRFHRLRNEFALAHLVAQRAKDIPLSSDLLFVDSSVYEWRCLDEYATSAYYVGDKEGGRKALERLIFEAKVPTTELPRLAKNLEFFV